MGELPSAEERKYLWLALRKTVDLLGQGYILDLALCLYGTETEKGQSENIFWNKNKFQIQLILSPRNFYRIYKSLLNPKLFLKSQNYCQIEKKNCS